MTQYKFTVNKELEVVSIDEQLQKIINRFAGFSSVFRKIDVLAGVIGENAGSVKGVIREGNSCFLKNYETPCLEGVCKSEITIAPIMDEGSEVTGAEVTVSSSPDCEFARLDHESTALISIGKTAASLAHGVRSPLNSIKGAIVFLRGEYGADPLFVEFARIIEEEIDKLDKFVTKFLSCSDLYSDVARIDVNPVIRNMVRVLGMQPNAEKITFRNSYGTVRPINADRLQIEHALINIINNSIESITGEGEITIRTYMNEPGTHTVIEIIDTGMGCNPGKATIKGDSLKTGRGYGLFLTNEIVKNLGGNLEVSGKKMVGTTVKVILPAVEG